MEPGYLYDSEARVLIPLWDYGPMTAVELGKLLNKTCGWNKNTTYTVVRKLVKKGMVARSEPGFLCTPILTREEAQRNSIQYLIDRLFDGSKAYFLAFFLEHALKSDEADEVRAVIRQAIAEDNARLAREAEQEKQERERAQARSGRRELIRFDTRF